MSDDDQPATAGAGEEALARAVAFDRGGDEAEAIPCYREALDLGLPAELAYRAHLGLGSSLRETGQARAAVAVHREAAARWPQRRANRLFLALALLDAEMPAPAIAEALSVVLEGELDDDLAAYSRALAAYADALRLR